MAYEITLPSYCERADDHAGYVNCFTVPSSKGDKAYVVAQKRFALGYIWSCSCPGWTRRPQRTCRHLELLGLPSGLKHVGRASLVFTSNGVQAAAGTCQCRCGHVHPALGSPASVVEMRPKRRVITFREE